MSTKKQSLLRIIAATSVSIFTLFSAFFGSYAWFVAMRASKNRADSFVLANASYITALNIYRQANPDDMAESPYKFSSTPSATYTVNTKNELVASKTPSDSVTSDQNNSRSIVQLGTYDPLFNKQKTLLFEFTVNCDAIANEKRTDLYLKASTSTAKEDSLVYSDENGKVQHVLQETKNDQIPEANKMSSVIEFASAYRSGASDQRQDFSSDSLTFTPFVKSLTLTGSQVTYTYDQSLSFDISFSSINQTTGSAYISLILQYNVTDMEYVLDQANNSAFGTSSTSIYSFWQDWTIQA